jgi:hypothetical protein
MTLWLWFKLAQKYQKMEGCPLTLTVAKKQKSEVFLKGLKSKKLSAGQRRFLLHL